MDHFYAILRLQEGDRMKASKHLRAMYLFLFCLSGFVMYTSCTFAGAMKFQALLQTHDPRIYVETIEESIFHSPYYQFSHPHTATDTGNDLGVFSCHRYGIFVMCTYVGFP